MAEFDFDGDFVFSNMRDGIRLGRAGRRALQGHCEHADGNAMLPVRFVNGRDLVIGALNFESAAVWDRKNLKLLQPLFHGSEIQCLAVSINLHQFFSSLTMC